MSFEFILVAALVGPLILGALTPQAQTSLGRYVLMGCGMVFPLFVATAMWIWLHVAGYYATSSSVITVGMFVTWWGAILLVPISSVLALLGWLAGRYWSNGFGT